MKGVIPVNDNPSPTVIAFTRDDFVLCAQALVTIIRITDDEELTPEIKALRFEANETLTKIVGTLRIVDEFVASQGDEDLKSQLN